MKKIPEIRFPEFSGEWVEKRLGEGCDFFSGGTPTTTNKEYWNGSIPFIKSGEIDNNKTSSFITETALKNSSAKLVKKGDLLFALYGATSGEVAISKIDGAINQAILCIRCKSIHIQFLYFLLLKNKKKLIYKYTQGGQPNLSAKIIKSLYFLIPPTLKEQQKIADFLSSIDEKIEIVAKKIEELKKYKKGLLQKLLNVKCEGGKCEPELRFKGFSGDWIKVKVKDIFDKITRGYVLSTKEISPIKTDEYKYPVYSSQTLNKGLLGYYKDYLYENAITWTTDGANAGKVIFRKGKFYCTNVSGVLISTKGYANQCIAEILNRVTKKYVSYVGNPKLMNNVMAEIPIFIPPTLAEQEKIAEFFSSIDEKIELNESKLQALKKYKQGLLQKMFV